MVHVRVLIVEDEVIVARTIASQLSQLGYIVTGTASSGNVAIAKALETKPDIVLMDIILKGEMDGIAASSYIREQLDIPVIFLTAYGDANTLERAKITQPFGYIVKPFTIKDLQIAIEIALLKYQLECDLRENRDQLATLLNSMSDAVIATDERGIVTFMNPASEKLTGWCKEEALGNDISQIFRLIDDVINTTIENSVTRALQEQQVISSGDYTSLIAKNGKKIPIGDKASPLMRRPNQIAGVVVVFWDLSAKRETELLKQALEKEQEVNRLKSLFISTVSHEFRNPLTVIQTAVELIDLKGANLPDAKRTTYVKRILTAVQTMKHLMDDVLFMGRSEAGKILFNPVPLNLHKFCQEIIEEFALIEGSLHEFVFTCESQNTDAVMDERLLHYILGNILSNAVKYSPEGGRIELHLKCDSLTGIATFEIQDQGIGIPEADYNKLFESFYRASNVQLTQGNGLGLVIVKRSVEAHKGQISFTSQVGVGTKFTVNLPLNPELSVNTIE
ncbi:response regulator [Tolypothrix sp. PCC 7910]|uniref:hybrid sensor histidine kinase/response regulator n=1 Tax=Tolypothrix sp. PCC 7910 TaxID=2099387 RepID=UPI0014279144|nr:hybrid sensor histidine kinase/response regulator [Tolypothrix sp. PCC 7910]QIR39530.1 response regulator [Tolypothrix sp. PCC 7910]